ncbi:hypothetical protein TNCV_4002771 [Trichonephila clavipes]|nr:hypothetical protein TNCV_4002771 [Trichonephila clavipes]
MSTVGVMQHSTRRTTYFAQHYPAAVEAIYPNPSVSARMRVFLFVEDSFDQQLASQSIPPRFTEVSSENALAMPRR